MKAFRAITLWLMIIGSLNWGLVGILNFNLVQAIFGHDNIMSKLIYTLVGVSGAFHLVRQLGKFMAKTEIEVIK